MRSRRFRRPAALAAAALLTVAASVLLAHEGHHEVSSRGVSIDRAEGHIALSEDAHDGLGVETAAVEVGPVDERLLAYATVTVPWTRHGFASSRLPGRVVAVHVVPGQVVKAGDLVAEVQSLELETLQLDLLTARTEVATGEKVVADLKATAAAGAVPGQSVDEAELKLAQARNALAVARSRWLALGLPAAGLDDLLRRGTAAPNLYLPVRVPVGGTVVRADLAPGRTVEPTDALAEVTDLSTVWVRLGVLEKDLYRVPVGTPVELTFAALPGETFRAAVTATAPFLDPVTHLAAVWAELPNPPGREPRLVPGMAGRAEIVHASEKPRPTVPVEAVGREGAERFVFVEEADTHGGIEYQRKPVALGRRAGGRVEVVAGEVYPGDRVVVRGVGQLGGYFPAGVLKVDPVTERAIGLRVEPAGVAPVDEVVTLEGAVDLPPAARGVAAAPLAGTLTALHTDRGRRVAAGDVLAELFSPELQAWQLDLIRATLERRLEADTLARIKDVPSIPRRRVWEAEGRVQTLTAQADALRRKLLTAGLTAEQVAAVETNQTVVATVPVRVPTAGFVVGLDRAVGQAVTAREGVFEVHDPARAAVIGYVPERVGDRVRVGQAVRVRLVAAPDQVLTGRVARAGRTVGADSRSQAVWVELDGPAPAGPLVHGQLATLSVVTGSRPSAVTVPLGAVAHDGGAAFVFVRGGDGVWERRAVEVGPADDRRVTITRGLAAGEPVATAGVNELMSGFAALK